MRRWERLGWKLILGLRSSMIAEAKGRFNGNGGIYPQARAKALKTRVSLTGFGPVVIIEREFAACPAFWLSKGVNAIEAYLSAQGSSSQEAARLSQPYVVSGRPAGD